MFSEQTWLTRIIWVALIIVALWSATQLRWSLVFVALATLTLSMTPVFVARWADIRVPAAFQSAVVLFVGGTLFLGEVFDFYERLWWWDLAMHGSSAIGFGLIGFVLVFMMFQGDRFAAPPVGVAFFAFCFAIAIGVSWEVFEFGMDQLFGFNMQKSGLPDTMGDLIVDMIGAALGAGAGWTYLKRKRHHRLARIIDEFIRRNPRLFKRLKK